jgi:putative endonuclease
MNLLSVFKTPPLTAKQIGSSAELRALNYFKNKRWKLLCQNYRSNAGEIDLIFTDPQDTVVFVEVKWRSSSNYGMPQETVNYHKQHRLIKTALYYIKCSKTIHKNFRFDIVAVSPAGIEHIPNAFTASGYTI